MDLSGRPTFHTDEDTLGNSRHSGKAFCTDVHPTRSCSKFSKTFERPLNAGVVEYRGQTSVYYRDERKPVRVPIAKVDAILRQEDVAIVERAFAKAWRSERAVGKARQIILRRYGETKGRSTSRGIPFDLTLEFLCDLYEGNDGRCMLTGIPLDVGPYDPAEKWRKPLRPSIDRIVPEQGYVQGNVRWVCQAVNYAMGAWGEHVLAFLAYSFIRQLNRGG